EADRDARGIVHIVIEDPRRFGRLTRRGKDRDDVDWECERGHSELTVSTSRRTASPVMTIRSDRASAFSDPSLHLRPSARLAPVRAALTPVRMFLTPVSVFLTPVRMFLAPVRTALASVRTVLAVSRTALTAAPAGPIARAALASSAKSAKSADDFFVTSSRF